jgi:uncharacterized protein YcaQ
MRFNPVRAYSAMLTLSISQARTMLLAAQGLCNPLSERPAATEVLEAIRRMGVLQIDTIHVVARPYEPKLLDDLLEQRQVFEYWSHEACFIPIEKYPLYRRQMLNRSRKTGRWRFLESNHEAVEQMLAHIAANGPVRSSDFERADGRKGSWWDWKHEKITLEVLHTCGDLMIAKRDRFQRIYDLRQSVLPDWSDAEAPSDEAALVGFVEDSVMALGIAHENWIADYFRLKKKDIQTPIRTLEEMGRLVECRIEGLSGRAYLHPSHRTLVGSVQANEIKAERTVLLSPFDPIVWDRSRARELFGFDYSIECYVPGPKRQYGYFVLPILHRDQLIGRLDAKAHRTEKVFEVKALYVEDGLTLGEEAITEIGATLKSCAAWHGTPKVKVTLANVKGLARKLQSAAR